MLARRKAHLDLITGKSEYSKEIHSLVSDNTQENAVEYVMSIHVLENFNFPRESSDKILAVMLKPDLVALNDNPDFTINNESIFSAKEKANMLDLLTIDSEEIVSVNKTSKLEKIYLELDATLSQTLRRR